MSKSGGGRGGGSAGAGGSDSPVVQILRRGPLQVVEELLRRRRAAPLQRGEGTSCPAVARLPRPPTRDGVAGGGQCRRRRRRRLTHLQRLRSSSGRHVVKHLPRPAAPPLRSKAPPPSPTPPLTHCVPTPRRGCARPPQRPLRHRRGLQTRASTLGEPRRAPRMRRPIAALHTAQPHATACSEAATREDPRSLPGPPERGPAVMFARRVADGSAAVPVVRHRVYLWRSSNCG